MSPMILWHMTQRHLVTPWLPRGRDERKEIDTVPTTGITKNDAMIPAIAKRN